MAKMLGRLGWFGQCSCCNGNRDKRQMKRLEQSQWIVEEYEADARYVVVRSGDGPSSVIPKEPLNWPEP